MRYLIGMDVGTQGVKAALFDEAMNFVVSAFEPSNLISPAPGVVWQEPLEMYADCAKVTRELMEKSGVKAGDVAGVGLDGQMAGIMGIDKTGEASTPYDSWLDMRCGRYMDDMNKRAGRRIIELSGGPATYVHGPKILWLKNENPDAYKKTAKFVLPHAYIVGKMCGLTAEDAYFDYTHLHFSCFADNRRKTWSDELLETFGVEKDKMARIVSPFEIVGHVASEFAALSGLLPGTPVVAGCGDTAASTFGSGMFEKDLILDCAGTASVLSSVVDTYAPDVEHATLTQMRSPVDGLYVPLAYINGGGMCVRWFRDHLSGTPHMSYDALEAEAREVMPGSEGLIFIPHFAGRVLPSNPNLKGAYLGLDFMHTRGHMYRAVLEAVAYEYAYYLSVLRALHPRERFDRMITVGGGAKSDLFNQIKADVLGVEVETFAMGETALIGSAVIAGVGTGLLDDYAAPIRGAITPGNRYLPDEKRHALYTPSIEAYLSAMERVTPYYRENAIYNQG